MKNLNHSDLFRVALTHLLKEGKITQADFAKETSTHPSYLSEFLNAVEPTKRERYISEWSNYFGKSVLEMMSLGAELLQGGVVGPQIIGNRNIQSGNITAGGDVITDSNLSAELSELIDLLQNYASKAEIKQLIKQYRGVKGEYEE